MSRFARLIEEKRVQHKLKEPIKLDSVQPNNKSSNGRTLEDYFGINENNKQETDLGFYEIKTTSVNNSYVKLFTRKPFIDIEINERSVVKYLTKRYGKMQDEKLSFYCRVELNKKTSYNGYELYYNIDDDKLILHIEENNIILDSINWNIIDIFDILERKIPNLIHTKTIKHEDSFTFTEPTIYNDLNIDKFKDVLCKGDILIDFNVHQRNDGKLKDHGCGFLIHRDNLIHIFDAAKNI